jgi:tetratricopeptide (TPR) repeat protein
LTDLEERVRALEAELAATPPEDVRAVAHIVAQLGSNLEAIGQHSRAVTMLKRAVALFEVLDDWRGIAESLNRLGDVLAKESPSDARQALHRALTIAREHGHRSEEATSLNNLAILAEVDGDLDGSLETYRQSIEVLRELDDRAKLASTLNNLGVLLVKRDEREQAQTVWREATSLLEQLDARSVLASTHNNLGMFLEKRGDSNAAIARYREAIAIQERLGDVGELCLMLGNVAHAYRSLDQHDEAMRALERKVAIEQQSGDSQSAADTLYTLAMTGRGEMQERDVYYARAIEAFEAIDAQMDVALMELERARAWSNDGDHATALAMGERAVARRAKLGNELHLATAMHNLATLYRAAGDHAKAISLFEESLALHEQLADPDQEGALIVLCNLADEYSASDLEVRAIEVYLRALSVAEATGDRSSLSDILDELGRSYKALANDGAAIGFTRRALAMYQEDGKDADVKRLRSRLDMMERRSTRN